MSEREQDHALVMRHERTHDGAGLSARQARGGVVDSLVQAEAPGEPVGGETLQVLARRLGCHHQRQRRRVGRNDEILREPALQPQAGHAERAILIVEAGIDRVVAALRNAPGHAALLPVRDLSVDGHPAGLVEQRVLVRRHDQQRHQVLEHRTAPRQEHRLAARGREQAPEREPVLLRQLSLRDRHEAGKPCFRGEQVVIAGIAPTLVDVVADGQQVTRRIVEKVVIHASQVIALPHQAFDFRDPLVGATACGGDALGQRLQPGSVLRRHVPGLSALEWQAAIPPRAPRARAKSESRGCRAGRRTRSARPAARSTGQATPARLA